MRGPGVSDIRFRFFEWSNFALRSFGLLNDRDDGTSGVPVDEDFEFEDFFFLLGFRLSCDGFTLESSASIASGTGDSVVRSMISWTDISAGATNIGAAVGIMCLHNT